MPRPKSRTVIIGKGDIAVNCLEYLASIDELPVLIICDKDDTGKDTWAKSLLGKALELGYTEGKTVVVEVRPNQPEFIKFLRSFKADTIFSLQPRTIFRQQFIDSAGSAVINLHFAPLPKLRGVAPCSWAITDGLESTGATFHLITKQGVDIDPVLSQQLFPIGPADTAWTLFQKCIECGTGLFIEHYNEFKRGNYKPAPQDETISTYHPMGEFRFDECEPDLQESAVTVDRFIRSRIFPPIQLPYVVHNGKKLWITGSSLLDADSQSERPGITVHGSNKAVLQCGRGKVAVHVAAAPYLRPPRQKV